MKKYPKLVQTDKRGQIVIPKDVRVELGIDESTGFYIYAIPGEGILLKQVDAPDITEDKIAGDLKDYADKLGIKVEDIEKALDQYKKEGGLKDV